MSRPRLIAGVLLAVLAFTLLLTGVAFAGTAIFLLLRGATGDAYAAAVTSLILLLPASLIIVVSLSRSPPVQVPAPALAGVQAPEASMNATLAALASHHPLMAVCCAAALGFATAISRAPR